ncbi:MAG: D-glycero-beta-D-manno-heptose 1,7-bisphosphate 7-phosphatase [Clostridia bacterium]|nr:D-glycero-beta-D-manno-heptose 1,7-bisphosphate 7-phosphatase [Clostridia bacterium]
MKTVLIAGGKGTRISSLASDIPKPMIKIDGKPVLEHQIECLRRQGFTDIIITVSHLGETITDYFGDGSKISPATGKPFGVNIEYYTEQKPLGNAGALFRIKDRLTEDFLLINADLMFDIDLKRLTAYHRSHGGAATIFTHPNSHPYDSSLIVADDNGSVAEWLTKEDERPTYYKNRVNAGIHVLSRKILDFMPDSDIVDLDRDILKPLAGTKRLYCYDSPEYVRDMGTPERYNAVCRDFMNGILNKKNLDNKQKAVFLDRDGTINKHIGFLTDIDDFELLPDAAEAIKKINESGYLAIIATNQPVIARGEITQEELKLIHDKMETLLGQKGAYIDGIYFCPHHPDKGFNGEIAELKTDCLCRKPNPGMLLQAADYFNIELEQSWMIGDSENDIKAGIAAGCKTALIGNGNFGQNITADTLLTAVEKIEESIQ